MAGNGKPIDAFRRATARRLRAGQTNAELHLWKQLRRIEVDGTHFRRQVPIGPFVADFACLTAKLLIELDGSQHGTDANTVKDERRSRFLESEGYRVLRFWNNDVMSNTEGVLDTIHAALYGSRDEESRPLKHERRRPLHPTPARFARRPSPSRGG